MKTPFRILNAEPGNYSPEARSVLTNLARVEERQLSRAELLAEVGSYDVLIVRLAHRIDREIIDAGARLRAM